MVETLNEMVEYSGWKEYKKTLENFREMMKLVKKYPVKSMTRPKEKPYEISSPIIYF